MKIQLGTISYYNGLLFDRTTSLQADCEGALAVGGNAQFGSGTHGYDIGGAGVPGWESIIIGNHKNPHHYPSLLLGGTVDINSASTRVHAGKTVMKLSHQQHYEAHSFRFECADGVWFVEDETCEDFFAEAKKQVCYTSDLLTQGNSTTITQSDLQQLGQLNLSDYENTNIKTDAKILCFNLDCNPGDTVKVSEIHLTDALLDYDTVVINIPAETVTFADGAQLYDGVPIPIVPSTYPGNQLIQDLAARLIFNCPNAREVNMANYSVIGSIIAPNAAVLTTGGSINGMLIADSLFQDAGMQLHAFPISLGDTLWELDIDPPVCDVSVVTRDDSTHTALPGALFSLYQYNEETAGYDLIEDHLAVPAGGVLIIEALPVGDYKLVETKAPHGYALPEDTETLFEIKTNDEGEIIQVDTIYIDNEKARGHVNCLKIDSEDHNIKLRGAVFSLFMKDEHTHQYDLVASGLTTLANGTLTIENLLPGDYKLVETKAPDGYYLKPNAETHFTIALDHEGDIIPLPTIDIENTKLGCVLITKIDAEESQIKLPGAHFTLKKLDTETGEYEEIRTGLVTDEHGNLLLDDLYPGAYKLVETKAPYGYKLPSNPDTLFTIEL